MLGLTLVLLSWVPTSIGLDEGCESLHWQRVQRVVAGQHWPPSAAAVQRLAEEEAQLENPTDSAGCEPGRFVASVWQLVYSNATERAWHLGRKFGVGFYQMAWQPSNWRVFGALAALQRQMQEDPPSLYDVSSCAGDADLVEAETEWLGALQSTLSSASGTRAGLAQALAPAARFLLRVDKAKACPLAVTAALWTLAATPGSSSSTRLQQEEDYVTELIADGEELAKSWLEHEFPFQKLLTATWPLFDLLAALEAEKADQKELAAPASRLSADRDPREPVCPRSDRAELVKGLENQTVEAIVVFGRMDRVKILHRYLLRNLRKNGGVIDKVHFVVFAAMREDLDFMQALISEHAPWYSYPVVTGRRLAKIYSICTNSDTVYLKIDDDMVYFSDEAVPEMVRERLRERCGMVSANVINHAILSPVHQDIGALRNFFPDQSRADEQDGAVSRLPWLRADEEEGIMPIEKKAQSQCIWATWQCAAWMHESFLSRLADGTQCAYDFGWHNFHASGYGAYQGNRFVALPHTRWSINMIAFKAEDVRDAVPDDLAEDDEQELSVVHPARLRKKACAVGKALAAHFSYSRQDDGLVESTDLLERYAEVSLALSTL